MPDMQDFAAANVSPTVFTATSQSAVFDLGEIEEIEASLGVHAFLRTTLAGTNNDLDVIARRAGAATAATATTSMSGANNDITLTAARVGEDLNDYRLRVLPAAGPGQSLAVALNGREINVTPATNASGAITTTGGQLFAALNANPSVSPLFTGANAGGNDGTGTIAAFDAAVTAGGIGGTTIRFRIVVSGNNTALSVTVSGLDITVNSATDGGGLVTSTATQVINAIQGSSAASALVTVGNAAANDGTGAVAALAFTNLSAPTGSTPTLDVTLQHDHGEGTWDTVDNFAQKTTVLTFERDTFGPLGQRGRWNFALGGGTPVYAASIFNAQADVR